LEAISEKGLWLDLVGRLPQGYWDTILIGFDAVVPNILLTTIASSIYVFTVGPMERIIAPTQAKNTKKTRPRS
jgi:hypothetical protein